MLIRASRGIRKWVEGGDHLSFKLQKMKTGFA